MVQGLDEGTVLEECKFDKAMGYSSIVNRSNLL